ncbi:hypothetical protein DPMN_146682 [Dreissena polymorpha]|uniref:Uncharacterized protein n=1 Tax=Dreissena polymorpha TaxID=45954 RepID=A0A9D4J2K9_DREPO|nr:hypothetical protein DPMN_146682 [Dreissena polymorpha]
MAPNGGPWRLQFSVELARGFVEISYILFSVSNSRTNSNLVGENVTVPDLSGIGGRMCGGPVSSVGGALVLKARCPEFESRTGCTLFTIRQIHKPNYNTLGLIVVQTTL